MSKPPASLILAVCLALAVGPSSAAADDLAPTVQAQELNATFLAYAPAPPGGAGAVCVVDSGVDVNPDTQAALLLRETIDAAQTLGDARGRLSDGSLYPHGTLMTMLGAGPRNGWGTVGIWPLSKVVSVNGMPSGEHDFPIASYNQGIRRCVALASSQPIKAILLAIGHSGDVSGMEAALLENSVYAARNAGLNVVAAAGNDAGAVNWPAAFPPVVAVAAGKLGHQGFCNFSSRGAPVDVIVPGCDIDQADPDTGTPQWGSGTSQASGLEAFVIDALKSYRPDLTPDEAEQLLATTAQNGVPDVRAAFQAAGLRAVVDAGEAAEAAALQSRAAPSPSPTPIVDLQVQHRVQPRPTLPRWRKPVATVSRGGNVATVRVHNRVHGARLVVEIQRAWELGWRTLSRRGHLAGRFRLNIRPGWRRGAAVLRLAIFYERDHAHMRSRPVSIRL